jgi:hypothetical protein
VGYSLWAVALLTVEMICSTEMPDRQSDIEMYEFIRAGDVQERKVQGDG